MKWRIEKRGDTHVVVFADGGCQPAQPTELEAWQCILQMKAALKGAIAHPHIPPDDGRKLPPWLRRVYDAIRYAQAAAGNVQPDDFGGFTAAPNRRLKSAL